MSPDVPRRSLLAAGMGLTLAGLGLAACSPSAETSSGSGGGSSGGAGAANSVKAADVPVGGGVIMTSGSYVVTQPTEGTFKAFSSVCTHEGCPVSKITNGQIVCTCHNSHFSVSDGSVISGPARRALTAAKVTRSGDSLVVS